VEEGRRTWTAALERVGEVLGDLDSERGRLLGDGTWDGELPCTYEGRKEESVSFVHSGTSR
jgi:hypothetical protein